MKKVSAKWVIAVSAAGKIKVKKGDKVSAGTVVAQEPVITEKVVRLDRLSAKEAADFGEKLLDQAVDEGEVVFSTGGIFAKKIKLPYSGKIVKIDEFKNVYIRRAEAESESRPILSPTEAVVESTDEGRIGLKFEALEFSGVGLNEGREWADNGIDVIGKILDLNADDKGKIILTKELTAAVALKAEVVGVRGVVILSGSATEKDDRINFKLPLLELPESEWKALAGYLESAKQLLINAGAGRILLVTKDA